MAPPRPPCRVALALCVAPVVGCDIAPLHVIDVDVDAATGALAGVWCDDDGDGAGGLVVVDDSGAEVARVVTDASGGFAVSGLAPGGYRVVDADANANDDSDGDVTFAAAGVSVDVSAGATATLWDDSCDVACSVSDVVVATSVGAPVDILLVIDSSRSMSDDNAAVAAALNTFSFRVLQAGVDARVVLIGKAAVPAPLSSLPIYRHVDVDVDSDAPLVMLLATRAQWQGFVRAESKKQIVVVTDDDSAVSADAFLDGLGDGGGFDDVTVHAVYAYGADRDRGCSTGARFGSVYETLVDQTGGTRAPVCSAAYDAVFDVVADVVTAAALPCTLAVPPLPQNTVVTGAVITWRAGDGDSVYDVDVGDVCGSGWAFVDDATVAACPDACAALQRAAGGAGDTLSAVFSCALP